MTQFLTTDTALPAYMAYPKFLLEMIDLSETARLVYILLLDRARVSQVKGGWADKHGNVFIFYPIKMLFSLMVTWILCAGQCHRI